MIDIQKAIDDLIDAADRVVNRKDPIFGDGQLSHGTLIPSKSMVMLDMALHRVQKAMEQERGESKCRKD